MAGALRFCWIGVIVAAPAAIVVQACGYSSGECSDKALCPEVDGAVGPDTEKGDGSGDSTVVDAPFDSLVVPDGPLPDGTCNGGAEDCTNNKDDNCNGLIDCADPVCTGAGYSCADVPNGWTGPTTLWEAANGPAPGCVAPFANPGSAGNAGLNAGAAACTCSCPNPAQGQTCTGGATVNIYFGANCGGQMCTSIGLPPNNFCVSTSCAAPQSFSATAPMPSGGSCMPSSSTSVPPVTWSSASETCKYSSVVDLGGCTNNAFCIAKPAAPFGGVCVSQSGDVPCPGGYATKHLYYTGTSDSRGCSACACNSPTGGTCQAPGGIQFFSQPSCNNITYSQPFPVGCQNIGIGDIKSAETSSMQFTLQTAGTCTSSGGQPQGSASAASPFTVCCR
jgi:hypothetical protein